MFILKLIFMKCINNRKRKFYDVKVNVKKILLLDYMYL